MGTYTNETDIESLTQFSIEAATHPNTAEVAIWITEIEADADARALGSTLVTDQLVDVRPGLGYLPKDSIGWIKAIASGQYDNLDVRNVISLPFMPIVSIISLSRRTSPLGSTDVWEVVTEGSGSGKSYIILKRRTKTNQYLGFALYFHNNMPYSGVQRVKATYAYGWNPRSTVFQHLPAYG